MQFLTAPFKTPAPLNIRNFGFNPARDNSFYPTLPPSSTNPTPNQAPIANYPASMQLMKPKTTLRWVLYGIMWSYSAAPTGGLLTWSWVEGGVTYTESYAITAAGPGELPFQQPKVFPTGTEVTITLSAGGSGVFGTLYATAKTQ